MPDDFPVELTVQVPRWRGIENIFGHIYKICDGMIIEDQAEDAGGESKFYVFDNHANYGDVIDEHAIYIGNQYRGSNWLVEVFFGDRGDIFAAKLGGGSSTTYFCDTMYNGNIPSTGIILRSVLLGGTAVASSSAGLGCSYPLTLLAGNSFGSRLCFLSE